MRTAIYSGEASAFSAFSFHCLGMLPSALEDFELAPAPSELTFGAYESVAVAAAVALRAFLSAMSARRCSGPFSLKSELC